MQILNRHFLLSIIVKSVIFETDIYEHNLQIGRTSIISKSILLQKFCCDNSHKLHDHLGVHRSEPSITTVY